MLIFPGVEGVRLQPLPQDTQPIFVLGLFGSSKVLSLYVASAPDCTEMGICVAERHISC